MMSGYAWCIVLLSKRLHLTYPWICTRDEVRANWEAKTIGFYSIVLALPSVNLGLSDVSTIRGFISAFSA